MNTCCDIAALRTAYDEKSLFPAYIREFEQKMKQYHTQALSNAQVSRIPHWCVIYIEGLVQNYCNLLFKTR